MSRSIPVWQNPFGDGTILYKTDAIEFKEGVTVLVGCNGSGKTTLLHCIADYLKDNNIPYSSHDNVTSGKSKTIEEAAFKMDVEMISLATSSSEGENIGIALGKVARSLYTFLDTGNDGKENIFEKYLSTKDEKEKKEIPDERWILFDAIDSGYSIDNIVEFKDFLKLIQSDAARLNKKLYIIISANSYEMAADIPCMDIYTGDYINFADYNDYKSFILKTADRKEERYKESNNEE